jgi:integrase
MQITPKIFFSEDLSKRSYVYFFIGKKRIRIYQGLQFGKTCSPNLKKTPKSRLRELIMLEDIVLSELKMGWLPGQKKWLIGEVLETMVKELLYSSYSLKYIRDCTIITKEFLNYCKDNGLLKCELDVLDSSLVETFLSRFTSSSAHYAIKRRTLSAVFNKIALRGIIKVNPVKGTSCRRVEAVHNQAFTEKQLEVALQTVKSTSDNLYLCVLFVYCMLLRPHREVRLLTRGNFNEDLTILTLSGDENKSKRIRSIPVPDNIRTILLSTGVLTLPDQFNIFTAELKPLNEFYFSTSWGRIKTKLIQSGVITANHTLYSFRHSAVCSVFRRDKDLHLIQRLCSHQSMMTSLKYLRSLGMEQVGTLEELPQFTFDTPNSL